VVDRDAATHASTGGGSQTWRGIAELAELVGAYCWLERRVFALTGAWASGPEGDVAGAPERRVFCAAVSRRHGALAGQWADRLPVRAGVDAAALVRAPTDALAAALEELDAVAAEAGLGALIGGVLPALHRAYGAHLRAAPAVSEAPVLEVLVRAHREVGGEIRGGCALLERFPGGAEQAAPLMRACERAFAEAAVFPAVRPS
jgi:hypothetical protein